MSNRFIVKNANKPSIRWHTLRRNDIILPFLNIHKLILTFFLGFILSYKFSHILTITRTQIGFTCNNGIIMRIIYSLFS